MASNRFTFTISTCPLCQMCVSKSLCKCKLSISTRWLRQLSVNRLSHGSSVLTFSISTRLVMRTARWWPSRRRSIIPLDVTHVEEREKVSVSSARNYNIMGPENKWAEEDNRHRSVATRMVTCEKKRSCETKRLEDGNKAWNIKGAVAYQKRRQQRVLCHNKVAETERKAERLIYKVLDSSRQAQSCGSGGTNRKDGERSMSE